MWCWPRIQLGICSSGQNITTILLKSGLIFNPVLIKAVVSWPSHFKLLWNRAVISREGKFNCILQCYLSSSFVVCTVTAFFTSSPSMKSTWYWNVNFGEQFSLYVVRKCESVSCSVRVRLFVTPLTVGHQAPLFMWFSRQEYWSGCHSFLEGIFLIQRSNLGLPHCR